MKTTFGSLTPFRQGSATKALDDNVYIAELPRCKPPTDTANLVLCKPPPYSTGGLPSNFRTRLQPTWRERKVPSALPPVPRSSLTTTEPSLERTLKPRTFSGSCVGESKLFSLQKKMCHSAGALETRTSRLPEVTSAKPAAERQKDVVDAPTTNDTKDDNVKVLVNKKSINNNKPNQYTPSGRIIKDSPRPKMNTPEEYAALSLGLNPQALNLNERRVAFGSSYICSPYALKCNPTSSIEKQRPTRSILRSRGEGQFFAKPPINPKTMIERCPDKDLPMKRKEEPMDYLTLHMLARRTRGPQRFKYMRMLAARQGQV